MALFFSTKRTGPKKQKEKGKKKDNHDICYSVNVGFLVCQKTADFCSVKLFLSQVVLS